jgi:hypothetical protein
MIQELKDCEEKLKDSESEVLRLRRALRDMGIGDDKINRIINGESMAVIMSEPEPGEESIVEPEPEPGEQPTDDDYIYAMRKIMKHKIPSNMDFHYKKTSEDDLKETSERKQKQNRSEEIRAEPGMMTQSGLAAEERMERGKKGSHLSNNMTPEQLREYSLQMMERDMELKRKRRADAADARRVQNDKRRDQDAALRRRRLGGGRGKKKASKRRRRSSRTRRR